MADAVAAGQTESVAAGTETEAQVTESVTSQTTSSAGETPAEKTYSEPYVQRIHAENASRRKHEGELEAQLKSMQTQLNDYQQLQTKYAETLKERDEALGKIRKADVMSAAAKAGAQYPDLVAEKVPLDAEDLDAAMNEMRKTYPLMFRTNGADAGAGTNSNSHGSMSMNDWIRQPR